MNLKPLWEYPADALGILFGEEVELGLFMKVLFAPLVIFLAMVAALFNLK